MCFFVEATCHSVDPSYNQNAFCCSNNVPRCIWWKHSTPVDAVLGMKILFLVMELCPLVFLIQFQRHWPSRQSGNKFCQISSYPKKTSPAYLWGTPDGFLVSSLTPFSDITLSVKLVFTSDSYLSSFSLKLIFCIMPDIVLSCIFFL